MIRETLESLDGLILGQYEKITQAAQKRLGWNKYDLVRLTSIMAEGAAVGVVTYQAIQTFSSGNPFALVFTPIYGYFAYLEHIRRSGNKILEEMEYEAIEKKGAALSFPRLAFRPPFLALGTYFVLDNLLDLNSASPKEQLIRLSGICLGFFLGFGISQSYFLHTTLNPPKKKKVTFKSMYETVKGWFAPPPQLEPIKDPAGNNYFTIDDAVLTATTL